jgi:hypothetical protein
MVVVYAFPSWEAVSSIEVLIWNEEPLMGFQMCLSEQNHIYMRLAAVYWANSAVSKWHLH